VCSRSLPACASLCLLRLTTCSRHTSCSRAIDTTCSCITRPPARAPPAPPAHVVPDRMALLLMLPRLLVSHPHHLLMRLTCLALPRPARVAAARLGFMFLCSKCAKASEERLDSIFVKEGNFYLFIVWVQFLLFKKIRKSDLGW
jgi:hypothetical protein